MDDPTVGCLSHTLSQLWGSGAQYVAFNDQPATPAFSEETDFDNFTSGTTAHSKGLIAFGTGSSGFWLTHSVPLFPLTPSQVCGVAYVASWA